MTKGKVNQAAEQRLTATAEHESDLLLLLALLRNTKKTSRYGCSNGI